MVHARHSDPNTLSRHLHTYEWHRLAKYLLGDEGRTIVSNLFRGLSVTRNPNLWQRLSAEKQDELGNTEECHTLKEEISALEGATDKKSISRRETLYQKKHKLFNNALRDWQKSQTNKYSDRP